MLFGCFEKCLLLFSLLILANTIPVAGANTEEILHQANSITGTNPTRALALTDSLLQLKGISRATIWKTLVLQSKINIRLRKIDEAIVAASRADSLYNITNPGKHLYGANLNLGICYGDKGQMEKSLTYYHQALDEAETPAQRLNCIYNLSGIAIQAGDTASVLNYYSNFDSEISQVEPQEFRAYLTWQYAGFLSRFQYTRESLRYYFLALNQSIRQQDYERACFCCEGILDQYKRLGKSDSCSVWIDSLMIYQEKSGSLLARADAHLYQGTFLEEQGLLIRAAESYQQALKFAEKANYVPLLEDCLKQLSAVYEQLNNYEQSVYFLKQYYQMIDSTGEKRWNERLSELQLKYESKRKEKQLNRLKQQLLIAGRLPLFLILLSLLFLGGLFYVLHRWKIAARATQSISELVTMKKRGGATRHLTMTDEKEQLWESLERLVKVQKIYKDPDLNLIALAEMLGTNRTTLSELINFRSGKSFIRFINHYRIQEACLLLKSAEKSHLSIEGIGQETGFKNRSTFYNAFVSEIGTTPAKYRKKSTFDDNSDK
jgi:AraC-like DNA-binding protein